MHVHWHEGLFLQPHHLQIMQRGLQSDLRKARALLDPYCYGVLESRLSQDDLADGRIRFERLRAIMPSGQEVFFPEDANLPALDIRAELLRTNPLDVSLAVPLWTSRANSFRPGESADPRIKLIFIPHEVREVADENTGENSQAVHVRKINARLALKGEDLTDMESLPLLRVARVTGEESGKARQDPDLVPPCVLLRSSPVLHGLMQELAAQLNASREDLRLKAATGGLGLEVKWELTMRLTVLNRFCASLPSLVEEGIVSPFVMYRELRELLGELLALHPEKTTFNCEAYNHLDPFRSLKELDLKIRELIRVKPGREPLRVPFSGSPGLLRATLEPQHFEKPTGYYIGIRIPPGLDRTKLAIYMCDGNKFKLMPSSMETMAILGLELKEQPQPPLDLPGEGYYFSVVTTSNQRRWDQIKQDKAVSLVWNNSEFDLSAATFTLFMTLPAN